MTRRTVTFASTTKVLANVSPKYYRISQCMGSSEHLGASTRFGKQMRLPATVLDLRGKSPTLPVRFAGSHHADGLHGHGLRHDTVAVADTCTAEMH